MTNKAACKQNKYFTFISGFCDFRAIILHYRECIYKIILYAEISVKFKIFVLFWCDKNLAFIEINHNKLRNCDFECLWLTKSYTMHMKEYKSINTATEAIFVYFIYRNARSHIWKLVFILILQDNNNKYLNPTPPDIIYQIPFKFNKYIISILTANRSNDFLFRCFNWTQSRTLTRMQIHTFCLVDCNKRMNFRFWKNKIAEEIFFKKRKQKHKQITKYKSVYLKIAKLKF